MNKLQIFKNDEFGEIRTKEVDSNPYICLVDVCKILDLEQVSRVKSRLNQDGVIISKVIDNLGREQQATFINESNLYKVIFQSRKPEAEKFTEWVTSEVLPSIRKTGEYRVDKQDELINIKRKNADARLRNAKVREAKFLLEAVDKYKNVLAEQSVELLTINALEIINGKDTLQRPRLPENKYYTATQIGKELGVSANKVGKIANSNNLKTDEYGMFVLDKSRYSEHQAPTFRYNEKGKEKIKELIEK